MSSVPSAGTLDKGAVSAIAVATASGSGDETSVDASGGNDDDVDFAAMDVLDAPELGFCGARQSVSPNGTLILDGAAILVPTAAVGSD